MDRMKREARRAQDEAAAVGLDDVLAWWRGERARLDAADLTADELLREHTKLMGEMLRRQRRVTSRAKRQNSIPKLLERDVMEGRDPLERYLPHRFR